MKLESYKVPGHNCPQCGLKIERHTPITDQAKRPIFKGMLFICGNCGTFLKAGDSELERLTVREFKALPTEMQRLLGIARYKIEQKQN